MTDPNESEILSLLDPAVLKGSQGFEPKLTLTERCEILALDLAGVSRRLVAAAYKVNRSTVNFIVNPHSRHYRNVRKILQDMGRTAFLSEYLTPEVAERINAAKADPDVARETQLTNDELKAERAEHRNTPSKGARSHEGTHRVRDFRWEQAYSVETVWLDYLPGWALVVRAEQVAKLLGNPGAEDFWHNTSPLFAESGTAPEAFATSKQALDSWMKTHNAELA